MEMESRANSKKAENLVMAIFATEANPSLSHTLDKTKQENSGERRDWEPIAKGQKDEGFLV